MCIGKYPTKSELEEVFELRVDERNGHETLWRKGFTKKDGSVYKEKRVECVPNTSGGYCGVGFKGRTIYYHTIVYILANGEIPEGLVVLHKDSHSKICNQSRELRIGTPRKNNQERQAHLDGKLCGCCYNKSAKKWMAYITINDKEIHLGLYPSEKEASSVYKTAHKMLIDGFGPNFIQRMMRIKTKNECTSQYKGVCWHKPRSRWVAQIQIGKNKVHMGYFSTEEGANAIYNKAKQITEQYVDPEQFRTLVKSLTHLE